ncbi:COG1470 family protein [Kineosporia babensis]|uniref:Carboxypeptidase regulatory-like domain-containing protein n=1 Tax=Kineosporia babensis TaxID=499548 RepID=A0A9X1NAX7_9ACTN|nr:hypothetical protein [Kineosporia babensis]MCD5310441.1 hypothetical protein [Kineosporia babensis]
MIANVSPNHFVQQAGVPVQMSVSVENPRDVIAGVSIRVLGADPDWAQISEADFSLFPGETRTVSVYLSLPDGFPAGAYPITVQVQEIGGLGECVLCPVTVDIPDQELLLLNLKPHLVHGGKEARFGILIENAGNTSISRPLTGQDEEDELRFRFDPEHVELAPGERTRASVTVSRHRPWTGMPIPHMFSVFADPRPIDERKAGIPVDSLGTQGAFLQKPWISRTTLALGSSLLAILVIMAIGVATVAAILHKNEADQVHTDNRLAGFADPDSRPPEVGPDACPCSFSGRVKVVGDGYSPTPRNAGSMPQWRMRQLLYDMRVSIYPVDDTEHPVWAERPNRDGSWRAEVRTAGEYLIRFGGAGLVPTWYPQAVDPGQALKVVARGGDTKTSKDSVTELPTMLIGVARGSVTVDLNIDDLSGAKVEVLTGEGTAVPCARAALAKSPENDNVFVATDLPTPGSYLITATKEGYTSEAVPITLLQGENRDVDSLALRKTGEKQPFEDDLCIPKR